MDNNIKYSSSEIEESPTYNLLKTPIKFSSNLFNKIDNYNKNNSLDVFLFSLNKSFSNFYGAIKNIFQEINNNSQSLNNQILFSQNLLSVIKNEKMVNIEINNGLEKINNHLIKMNLYKKEIDKNILIINKQCIYFHNTFKKLLKNIKNKCESAKKIEKNFFEDNILNNEIDDKYFNKIDLKRNNEYDSCITSIDRGLDGEYSHRYNNNEYSLRNKNILKSYETKKSKRYSYDKDITPINQKIKNSLNKVNSAFSNNKIQNIQLYNIETNLNRYYKNNNNENIYFNPENIMLKKNLKRCSSVSNEEPNFSNVINNYYNGNKDNGKTKEYIYADNINSIINENKIHNNKLELELALKAISFFKAMNKIQQNSKNKITNTKENKQKFNKLKNYIIYLSKKIIEKYNNNNINIDNIIKDINNGIDINKKYENLLLENKNILNKLNNLQNENKQIKTKYAYLNKTFTKIQQKYKDLLLYNKIINSPKKEKQIINRNSNIINNELLLSQKITDVTKLSHQNSVYLLEMNKIQKEKNSLLKKLADKEKYIKSLVNTHNKNNNILPNNEKDKKILNFSSSYLHLVITKHSFSIKNIKLNSSNKNEINYFNNLLKTKEENVEKLKIKINQLELNYSKLTEEIKQKSEENEIMNKKIDELNKINNINQVKIKEITEDYNNNEKINKEKINNLIKDKEKLIKENEKYININKNNIKEINEQKNTINELQKKLNKNLNNSYNSNNSNNSIDKNNKSYINKSNNNFHSINNSYNNSYNEELYRSNMKEGKDIMTPSFLSPERNSKHISLDAGGDSNDLGNIVNNNKSIINEYESKVKLLKESNNQLIKELNDMKNNNNNNNGNKKIYKPEEYLIISDKNKDGLKWFLIKNKKFADCKNSYDNLFWVENDCILDIKQYNKFKSEEDEMNEIIISNIKKLEEKEDIISKLSYRIENYELFNTSREMDEEPKERKKKIQKSKSEQNIKNQNYNIKNQSLINTNKFNINNDFEQNLNDNIRDDFSQNKYFYLEGNGLGLLNNDKNN